MTAPSPSQAYALAAARRRERVAPVGHLASALDRLVDDLRRYQTAVERREPAEYVDGALDLVAVRLRQATRHVTSLATSEAFDSTSEVGDRHREVLERGMPVSLEVVGAGDHGAVDSDDLPARRDVRRQVGEFDSALGVLRGSVHGSPSIGEGSNPSSPIVGAAGGADPSTAPPAPRTPQTLSEEVLSDWDGPLA